MYFTNRMREDRHFSLFFGSFQPVSVVDSISCLTYSNQKCDNLHLEYWEGHFPNSFIRHFAPLPSRMAVDQLFGSLCSASISLLSEGNGAGVCQGTGRSPSPSASMIKPRSGDPLGFTHPHNQEPSTNSFEAVKSIQ